jgi:hypothetical protein
MDNRKTNVPEKTGRAESPPPAEAAEFLDFGLEVPAEAVPSPRYTQAVPDAETGLLENPPPAISPVGARRDSTTVTTEDGIVLTAGEKHVQLLGEERHSDIRRTVKIAGCGCAILKIQDYFLSASGEWSCRTVPGHSVLCARCRLIWPWTRMTLIAGRRFCPRCRRPEKIRRLFLVPWHALALLLKKIGQ